MACWLTPLNVAVIATLWLPLTAPEVAANAALVCPGAMVTLAGTASNPLLLVNAMAMAPAAALFELTVQALDALLPSVEGVHTSDVSCATGEASAVSVKTCEMPFSVAVSMAA